MNKRRLSLAIEITDNKRLWETKTTLIELNAMPFPIEVLGAHFKIKRVEPKILTLIGYNGNKYFIVVW